MVIAHPMPMFLTDPDPLTTKAVAVLIGTIPVGLRSSILACVHNKILHVLHLLTFKHVLSKRRYSDIIRLNPRIVLMKKV